jgi:serine/threonine protein kinase
VRAVITDFGVARAEAGATVVNETRSGHETIRVAGTLAYMSPEQLSGDRVTTAVGHLLVRHRALRDGLRPSSV